MEWKLKEFNQLTVDELYEILRVRSEVFVYEQVCPYVDVDGKDKESYHLFLEDDNGTILAYLRIVKKGVSYDNDISFGRVISKKTHRRTGLGIKIVEKAIEFVTETLNENTIRISAQARLKDFYMKFGFKQVSDIYLEDDQPHMEMLYKKE